MSAIPSIVEMAVYIVPGSIWPAMDSWRGNSAWLGTKLSLSELLMRTAYLRFESTRSEQFAKCFA